MAFLPYHDPHDDIHEDRARRLCAELTPEEKLTLLHQFTPGVDRIGLAPFRTGTEAAHGVAWEGEATVFPQPVGLAATWDAALLEDVGEAVGREVRDKHNADPWISLNVWAPVANPLRHPLWGRNEEGFSEDPVLTAQLATAYARGLRGRDPVHWRTVPTLKHYLGYNEENDRSSRNSSLPPRVLHDYELPAYKGPIEAGVVGGVMAAYNLVNGRPAHVDSDLINLARSWSPIPLCFFSDAFAPSNLWGNQGFYPDAITAYAAMLEAGIDSFTDQGADSATVIGWLRAAIAAGLVTEQHIDRAVERVLTVRARSGEFDTASDPFGPTHQGHSDPTAHARLARLAVGRSVVVLSNDGILPLRDPSLVAVIGPLGDDVFFDWYSGTASEPCTVADALRERYGPDTVTVSDGADHVILRAVDGRHHLRVVGNRMIESAGLLDGECEISIQDWGQGIVTLRTAGARTVWSTAADRTVRTDAKRVSDYWNQSFLLHRHADATWSIYSRGQRMWLRRRGTTGTLAAVAQTLDGADRFVMTTVRSGAEQAWTAAQQADVVVLALGNEPHTGAHETVDRSTLALPAAMEELARIARAANPRCVVALISSFPYSLGDLADFPAIVWSSHGGQELGHGLIDVLAGAVEPYGHLTQTWYAEDADLPPLDVPDVESAGATYWYGRTVPAYPFGHGLSYTTVAYRHLEVDPRTTNETLLKVHVELENTGDRPVDELVQLYVRAPEDKEYGPRIRLHAHSRLHLAPGERKHVELVVDPADLASWHAGLGRRIIHPGRYVIGVGPSSGDLRLQEELVLAGEAATDRPVGAPIDARTFDHAENVTLIERTLTTGQAVTPSRSSAHLCYDKLNLEGTRALTTLVSSPRASGHLRLEIKHAGKSWMLGTRQIRAADSPHEWHEVTWPLPTNVVGAHDVSVDVTLTAPVQLAEIRMVATASADLRDAANDESTRSGTR
ncbi:MAG: glycoside hydrolase family 3 C-terminal domain-containing protein [Arachnia sp.]